MFASCWSLFVPLLAEVIWANLVISRGDLDICKLIVSVNDQKIRFFTFELSLDCAKNLTTTIIWMSIPLRFYFWLHRWPKALLFLLLVQLDYETASSMQLQGINLDLQYDKQCCFKVCFTLCVFKVLEHLSLVNSHNASCLPELL